MVNYQCTKCFLPYAEKNMVLTVVQDLVSSRSVPLCKKCFTENCMPINDKDVE